MSSVLRRRKNPRKARTLGRDGVCPFCLYIGPPLLCGCVTELRSTLAKMAFKAPILAELTEEAMRVLADHDERVRVLNEELQRERKLRA